jgi:hypothetical protein
MQPHAEATQPLQAMRQARDFGRTPLRLEVGRSRSGVDHTLLDLRLDLHAGRIEHEEDRPVSGLEAQRRHLDRRERLAVARHESVAQNRARVTKHSTAEYEPVRVAIEQDTSQRCKGGALRQTSLARSVELPLGARSWALRQRVLPHHASFTSEAKP